MINSMTGFGKGEKGDDQLNILWEVKSVNNRFKDFRFRIPHSLNQYEIDFRKLVEAKFSRGSFELSCRIEKLQKHHSGFDLDFEKIIAFLKESESQLGKENLTKVNPTSLIRSEFKKEEGDIDQKSFSLLAKDALAIALDALHGARLEEGEKLNKVFSQHLSKTVVMVEAIAKKLENSREIISKRLKDKLKELFPEGVDEKIEDDRFHKEVLYYLEKLDLEEEISRFRIHAQKLEDIFSKKLKEKKNKSVGREIEFTLQEMNREVNTIGSKSVMEEVSTLVVGLKVELEKMREQALNIE